MTNSEVPIWYGKHDNPHHVGKACHLKRIATCEDQLEEYTGLRGNHISPKSKLSQREILKEAIDIVIQKVR